MAQVDYSPLDAPEISMNSFYPRQGWTPPAEGVQDYTINVGDDIGLSCRFFPLGVVLLQFCFFMAMVKRPSTITLSLRCTTK
ncbi:MAG: hypothetical protein Ct9H300mP11_01700 [Chloroflexota bacterium]|nr:MAG: hypothetical protein Ct9H300mP11_01700 [Chloroflexota bacterium]